VSFSATLSHVFQEQFDYSTWLEDGNYSKGSLVSRTVKPFMVKSGTGDIPWFGKMEAASTRSMLVSA